MKIDFRRTKQAVSRMLDEAVATFARKHPDVQVHEVRLWAFGFGKVAFVLLETSDDDAVFGGKPGTYNDNEFGRGVVFDDWWPDLYACKQDEPLEFQMPNGEVATTYLSKEGNDAIDKPLFALLKDVLREADLTKLNKAEPFTLAVEMGNSALEDFWE